MNIVLWERVVLFTRKYRYVCALATVAAPPQARARQLQLQLQSSLLPSFRLFYLAAAPPAEPHSSLTPLSASNVLSLTLLAPRPLSLHPVSARFFFLT